MLNLINFQNALPYYVGHYFPCDTSYSVPPTRHGCDSFQVVKIIVKYQKIDFWSSINFKDQNLAEELLTTFKRNSPLVSGCSGQVVGGPGPGGIHSLQSHRPDPRQDGTACIGLISAH